MIAPQQVEILNAVFTPMYDDGTVNYDRVPDMFHQSVGTGSQGVFVNGTTGECMSLSTAERMKLVEAWIKIRKLAARPDFKIIVHAGSSNLYETAEMARHAQECGADGVAMVGTFYFRPKSVEDLVDQCEFVASSAPEIPFYYYNIPALTGFSFPLIDFIDVAIRRIPNFAGLKNSFNDMVDYQHCLNTAGDKYSMYWGTDEAFMMLYTAGNRHYVGSTYNYMGAFYSDMLHAYNTNDQKMVIQLQREADSIYRILSAYNGIIAGKEIMRFIGVDCGPVRRPLKTLTREDSQALLDKLKETTLFDRTVIRPEMSGQLQQR